MSVANNFHEAIVIGAGISGIYQIKCLTDLGMDAILLEGDDGLGGTWYRNRYPGCAFDSESYTYGYSFSKELLDEWHWKDRFSSRHRGRCRGRNRHSAACYGEGFNARGSTAGRRAMVV